jgi:chromosome partitioning protein
MKTILVAGSKGGVGKSTIATQLAAYYALQDKHVVADADPQRSATRWAERRADHAHAVLPVDATRRKAWRNACPKTPSA